MAYPDATDPYILRTDASKNRLGAVFYQKQDDVPPRNRVWFSHSHASRKELSSTLWQAGIIGFEVGHL